jgi:excisionase family DNA binding protein
MSQILFQGIEVTDLIKQISDILDKKLRVISVEAPIDKKLNYLNRFEVASLLKISLPTLNNWSKSGILQSYRIGNRVLYREDEINSSLHKVRNLKYKRGEA